ncbi:MAG: ABC transporter permease [Gemmatimonadota bacterium]
MPEGRRFGSVVVALGALLVTAAIASLGLWAGGYDVGEAAGALVAGSVAGREALLSVTLVRAVPLVLTGLAVALAFRAGVWNIGAEGQLYAGALAAVWIGLHGGDRSAWFLIPSVLIAAGLAGAAWALVPALMKLWLGVGEVITTILMNFVGIYTVAYAVHGPLQEARGVFPQTDPIVAGARLPALVPGTRLHAGFGLAVVVALGLWAFFRWTRAGFAVRAVGASPSAARISGRIHDRRVVLWAFLGSGAVAGLAGGVEVAGVTYALYEGLSPGWGYTAIAVALLAGLHPGAVLVAGVLFGALEGGAGAMQRAAGIPAAWVGAVEALVILAVLAADQAWRRSAALLGPAPEREPEGGAGA